MNQTSSVLTGGVTISAATLVPLVTWAMNGCPHPIPESVPYLIAASIVTIGHAAYNVIIARQSKSVVAEVAAAIVEAPASPTQPAPSAQP